MMLLLKLYQWSTCETAHLANIPVYVATCRSLCRQPSYLHHKTTGTGCTSHYACPQNNVNRNRQHKDVVLIISNRLCVTLLFHS